MQQGVVRFITLSTAVRRLALHRCLSVLLMIQLVVLAVKEAIGLLDGELLFTVRSSARWDPLWLETDACTQVASGIEVPRLHPDYAFAIQMLC